MKLEIEHFGAGHMNLISPEDTFVEDASGFWGPEKTIPEVGTAKIHASYELVGADDGLIDVVKNRLVPIEELSGDMRELIVHVSTSAYNDTLLLRSVMPDGNAYWSGVSDLGFYDDKDNKTAPYLSVFMFWRKFGENKKAPLAVPGINFLSKIGFSFSRTV